LDVPGTSPGRPVPTGILFQKKCIIHLIKEILHLSISMNSQARTF